MNLIGVLIAMAITSILILAQANMFERQTLMSNTADAKSDLVSLVQSEMGVAITTSTCTTAVGSGQTIGSFGSFGGMSRGTNLAPTYQLTVVNVFYLNPVLVATAYDGTTAWQGNLTIIARANKDVVGGQTFAPRTIAGIYVTVNPGGQIVACGVSMPTLPTPPGHDNGGGNDGQNNGNGNNQGGSL